MNKKLIITESQYERIFNEENELLLTEWDYHDVLDGLAIASLLIPGAGPFVAAGIEGINALTYFYEGDTLWGGLSLALSLIPGGFAVRRLMKNKGLVKQADNLVKWVDNLNKSGKVVTEEMFEKEAIRLLGKSEFKNNKALLKKYFKDISKLGTKEFTKKFKDFDKLISKTGDLFNSFTKDTKLMEKYLKKNNDDMYKAFASYLKHDRLKETGIGLSLLSLLVAYGEPNPIDGTKEVEDIEIKTKTLDEIIKNKQIVKVGDKGDVVKEIQQLLIDLGFSVGSKGVDGKFGPDTKKGVMDFQSDNNIEDDGIVGPITAQKMLDTIKFDEKEYEDIDLEDFVIAKK